MAIILTLSPFSVFLQCFILNCIASLHFLNSFLKYGDYITLMEKALATDTMRPGFGIRIPYSLALAKIYNLSVKLPL